MDAAGGLSIWHWIIVFLLIFPNLMFISAIRKAGFSPWWVLPSIIPLVGLVLLWVWAYSRWPAEEGRR